MDNECGLHGRPNCEEQEAWDDEAGDTFIREREEARRMFLAEEGLRKAREMGISVFDNYVGRVAPAAEVRDIQGAQANAERVTIGDWVVIRNERGGEDEIFCPFTVAVVMFVFVDSNDVITSIVVQECGGAVGKGMKEKCDVNQTYKPSYKGINPRDEREYNMFYHLRDKIPEWCKPVYATLDPATIVEWGKMRVMMTTTYKLNAKTLEVINYESGVEWKKPKAKSEPNKA
jgi:hypothetical protein